MRKQTKCPECGSYVANPWMRTDGFCVKAGAAMSMLGCAAMPVMLILAFPVMPFAFVLFVAGFVVMGAKDRAEGIKRYRCGGCGLNYTVTRG